MAYTNTKKMFEDAIKNKYAVGAFNFSNMEFAQAIVKAAESNNRSVIIQASESACKYAGFGMMVAIVKNLAKDSKVDIALHLDHGKDFETCKAAIDAGFSSVMIDLSHLDFENNVAGTKKVVDYAKKYNVSVEAELGQIIGVEDDKSSDISHYTDPDMAKEFVNRTGVDSLAISIGTAHGVNKGLKTPTIRFDIIHAIEKQLKAFPLVCHGASTVDKKMVDTITRYGGQIGRSQGIPRESLKKMSKTNIVKINMDTDLRLNYTASIREYLVNNPTVFDPRKYLGYGRENLESYISDIIKNVLN